MQNALTPTGALCRARIMSGRMEGKQRKAARIPTTDTMTGRTFGIFLNIKTGTGWTNISACATSQTAFGLLFPNRTVECSRQLLTYIINIETGGNGCQILFLINFFGRCIFFHKEFNQCFAFCCQDFHQCTLIRQLRNLNITAGSITGPPVNGSTET